MAKFRPTESQEEAISAIGVNVAVSAGAGSGKTRVLVERYMNILYQSILKQLCKGNEGYTDGGNVVQVKNILAVTFTRKAAAEMKERVRTAINELLELSRKIEFYHCSGEACTLNSGHEMPWEKMIREEINAGVPEHLRTSVLWEKYLHDLDKAQITTIDSLCSGILREHPVEACLDPNFTVAEGLEETEFISDAVKSFLRLKMETGDKSAAELAEAYGPGLLKSYLQVLSKDLEEIQLYLKRRDFAASYRREGTDEFAESICRRLGELAGLKDCGSNQGKIDNLKDNLSLVIEGLRKQKIDWQPYEKYVKVIKNNSNKVKGILTEIRNLEQAIAQAEADREAVKLLDSWQDLLTGFAAYLKEKRCRSEFFGFLDIEYKALDLLQRNVLVRHKLQERYSYIMVDEFQDTNDLQRKLIYLLCGDDEERLQNRKLFVVGDPKQSIYRFRGADVSVFARVRRDISASEGGKVISLKDNYRSTQAVLTSCRDAFTSLMGTDESRDIFFEDLSAHGEEGVRPRLLQVAYTEEERNYRRELEADCVADEICKFHDRGEPFGEMAILLAKMSNCQELVAALRARNIPYNIIDGRGFYERQEVLDLLNLFKVLDNKYNSIELAGVLRSPYFGLNDETITALFFEANKLKQPLLDIVLKKSVGLPLQEGQRPLLERAGKILDELCGCSALYSLPELWLRLMKLLQVEVVQSVQQEGSSKLANIKKLYRDTLELCTEKKLTLSNWLDYVRRLKESGERINAANEESSDAVQIMTIHKAKGLEFKTVILPQVTDGVRSNNAGICFTQKHGLGISAVAGGELKKSSVLAEQTAMDKELEEEERLRLLYVAMTRAKENLLLTGTKNIDAKRESQAKNWMVKLLAIFEDNSLGMEVGLWYHTDLSISGNAAMDSNSSYEEFPDMMTDPLPEHGGSGRVYFSPSALQDYLYCQRRYYYAHVEELPAVEEAGEGKGVDAAAAGRLLHKALELYNDDAVAAFNKAVSLEGSLIPAQAEPLRKIFTDYIQSPLFSAQQGERQREWRFLLPVAEDLIFSGVVDCICVHGDGTASIVDYKTGRPYDAGSETRGYSYQLTIYKLAVEKLLRLKIRNVSLHFLRDISLWELPEEDLLSEIIALAEEIRGKRREREFTCSPEHCRHCPYEYLCDKSNAR